MTRTATAGLLAALAGLAATSAASAQVVPALDASGSASANAAAAARSGSASAQANASAGGGAASPTTAVPDHFPPPLPTLSPQHPLARRERRNVAMATRWRERRARPHIGADGVLHFTQGDGEPTVVCAPYRVCDVSLEAGENITDKPDIGDPRWITHPRISGTGVSRTIHIIIKPSDAGLDSNMVIETDRRSISVRLISRESEYMPYVKLDNPDGAGSEESAAWASVITGPAGTSRFAGGPGSPCDTPPVVPPEAYRLGTANVPWRPTQVYAVSTPVGLKTCIDFRADISSIDVPVLVALDSSGAEQVVSYRQQGRHLLVDRLIDHAELVAGVGGSQEKVAITRRGYR